jgi:hypothetical protein
MRFDTVGDQIDNLLIQPAHITANFNVFTLVWFKDRHQLPVLINLKFTLITMFIQHLEVKYFLFPCYGNIKSSILFIKTLC